MEKNCYVKRYKGAVNNSDLKYFNGIEVNITQKSVWAGAFLRFQYVGESFDVLCKDGGNHLSMSSDMSNPTNKITVPVTSSNFTIYTDGSTDYTIVMKCQYNSVGRVEFYGNIYGANIEDFCHIKNLSSFVSQEAKLSGNISNLNNLSGLHSFVIVGSSAYVTGNLSSFYGIKTLGVLTIKCGGFAGGELKDLADSMVSGSNPRTGDTLVVTGNGGLTLNGVVIPYGTAKTITFDSSLPNGYSIA